MSQEGSWCFPGCYKGLKKKPSPPPLSTAVLAHPCIPPALPRSRRPPHLACPVLGTLPPGHPPCSCQSGAHGAPVTAL